MAAKERFHAAVAGFGLHEATAMTAVVEPWQAPA